MAKSRKHISGPLLARCFIIFLNPLDLTLVFWAKNCYILPFFSGPVPFMLKMESAFGPEINIS